MLRPPTLVRVDTWRISVGFYREHMPSIPELIHPAEGVLNRKTTFERPAGSRVLASQTQDGVSLREI